MKINCCQAQAKCLRKNLKPFIKTIYMLLCITELPSKFFWLLTSKIDVRRMSSFFSHCRIPEWQCSGAAWAIWLRMQFLVCVLMTSSCSVSGGTICLQKLSSNSNMLYLSEFQLLRICHSAFRSQHMHQFVFLTWQRHEVHLDLKKILIMSFTVTITHSSRRLKTIFLTTVLEVWWIANQV